MIFVGIAAAFGLFCFTLGYFCREVIEWCSEHIEADVFDQEWSDAQSEWRHLYEA